MHVFSDFDGTISVEDATDFILSRFADSEWEIIEDEWKRGLIGSAECMQRQIALIHATRQELDQALDEISIDPGFKSFNDFCWEHGIPVTVISDGVDYFIKRILARHHLEYLPIIANELAITGLNGHTSYRLSSPYSDPACASASGVCKCRAVASPDMRIYIGDGRSDFCVSDKPDLIFAKGKLAEYCTQKSIPFIAYCQFTDVTRALQQALPEIIRREPTVANYAIA
jgi:2-hydroxy-3-keto-5-methylthiopentenyl-1-phosphate phosphatase